MTPRLNILSLREQVYEYLRNEMITGGLVPGSTINLNRIAEQLGISKTPLRDALIHLELEGFVTILPRKGVMVNALTLEDVSVLLQQTFGWLDAGQRAHARQAFEYSAPGYEATLRVVPKQPQVTALSVTNVRVTDRALEETIVLEFTVREAGIHELSFLLPSWMADARVQAPMLRQTTIKPAVAGPNAPLRVGVELQDDVMGQLRVLVEHDRLLQPQDQHLAPIPVIETGLTEHRFVTLEGAGRDEIVVASHKGLEPLQREQQRWRLLSSILGAQITQAYLVGSPGAELRFATKERKAVETVGASIPHAETQLVIDASGAYRGAQHYFVNNSTEQFLEVQLPAGARLWTVQVAGEPVKPVPGATATDVRIPLVKTATGDKDYTVLLKYGGVVSRPGSFRKIHFPILHTKNIRVEKSQVRLWLPPEFRWFDFDGTMRRVHDQGDLVADFLAYRTRELDRLSQLVDQDKDVYSSARAINNLKQLAAESSNYYQLDQGGVAANPKFQKELSDNQEIVRQVEGKLQEQQTLDLGQDGLGDNRRTLNEYWREQRNGRAYDIVNDLRFNFSEETRRGQESKPSDFDRGWFDENGLRSKSPAEIEKLLEARNAQSGEQGEGKAGGKRRQVDGESKVPQPSQPKATGVYNYNAPGQMQQPQTESKPGYRASGDNLRDRAQRYQQRLEQNTADPFSNDQSQSQLGIPNPQGGYPSQAAPPVVDNSGSMQNSAQPTHASPDEPPILYPPADVWESMNEGRGRVTFGTGVNQDAGTVGQVIPGTGLASLEVELPLRGQEFFFSTTGDQAEIEVRAISQDAISRILRLLMVLGVALIGFLLYRLGRRGWFTIRTRRGAVLLLLVGLLMTVSFVLPLYGLVAIFVASALLWKFRSTPSPVATA